MKKILLSAAILFACMTLSAQNKGDKFMAVSFSGAVNSSKEITADGASNSSGIQAYGGILGEFGYFAANNLRLAFCFGPMLSSYPSSLSETPGLRNNSVSFQLNPNIAYYVKITDRLYYTPEIGFLYQIGAAKDYLNASTPKKSTFQVFEGYSNVISFEFKVSPKIALGVYAGSIYYAVTKEREQGASAYSFTKEFSLDLYSAAIDIRFYF
jgi:hypothetical protein